MAKYKSNKDAVTVAIENLANSLSVAMNDAQTAGYYHDKGIASMISKESLTDVEMAQLSNHMVGVEHHLESSVIFGSQDASTLLGDVQDIPKHSLEAAAILVGASGNLVGYNQAQMSVKLDKDIPTQSLEAYQVSSAGELDIALDQNQMVSKESFDEKELNKFLNYSIIYNVMASQQDEFNKGFYKAITVTPDDVGMRISIRVEQVWNGAEHLPNGDGVEFTQLKRNLIDALTHPEVLETNLTDIIPYVQAGGGSFTGSVDPVKNLHHFVADGDESVAKTVMLEDVEILTAPLKTNMRHGLLGLSSHPTLIANGLMNDKDSLDSRVALKNIYLQVGDQYVAYPTHMLYTSAFYKAREGHMRKMTLSFDNNSFLVSKDLKDIAGKEVEAFKAITDAGYELRLRVQANGTAEVDSGFITISTVPVSIAVVYKDGQTVAPTDPAFIAVAGDLKLGEEGGQVKFVGYDIEARRTNWDLRSRGRMIDSTEYKEQIVIPLRSPISIIKPIVGGDKEHPDVKALVNATRIMANNDGVKTIIAHAELLERIVSNHNFLSEADRNAFPGIGRHFLPPCFIRERLHLPSLINSTSSENRLKDIQGAVSTKLNEIVGRILKTTNYIPVVEQMTGGNIGKLKVVIGTDYRLPQYIAIQGDVRLFGGKVDYEIVSTPNKHISNKIYLTLVREASDEGPDPFNYGMFVWSPQLVISTTRSLGAQVFHQHTVQPRYAHIINTPILAEIELTGIEEVTGESTVIYNVPLTQEQAEEWGNQVAQETIIPAGKDVKAGVPLQNVGKKAEDKEPKNP